MPSLHSCAHQIALSHSLRTTRRCFLRAAHSAASPEDSGNTFNHASSSRIRGSPSAANSTSRNSKTRKDPSMDKYRFPETGRRGGPPDPFEVMALDHNATEKQVKQQYYKLALLLHPDSSHPSSSPDHFAALNKAYKLLSKPSSRSAFLKTGYGWDLASSTPSADASMFHEIARRRRGGVASWSNASRQYRNSDAGRGAWGGFDGTKGWRPYETGKKGFEPPTVGTGEERYMSNQRFLVVICITTAVVAWLHWNRLDYTTDAHFEILDKQNVDASHALAQARYEAATHGHVRREQIRRRVRQAEVLKELERAEQGNVLHVSEGPPPRTGARNHE